MANFTSGNIDLSAENTFDNVIMGVGDTMDFTNSGKGGPDGGPIKVLGDFTIGAGAVITLRNGANLTPGVVTVLGTSRDLDAQPLNYGTPGAGGGFVSNNAGTGGTGGTSSDGTDGQSKTGAPGGAGGTNPSGNGGTGGSNNPYAGGGGGGGSGGHGDSTESVSFYVLGNISITGGTITGPGANASGNGGSGGPGGYAGTDPINSVGGSGGGGGAGGAGGHGGNLRLFHVGTAAEAFDTKTLNGGTATSGGGGGAAGIGALSNGIAGSAGGAGGVGDTGVVELIEVDTIPTMTTNPVTEIFALQAKANGEIESNGGNAITERGFVMSTSINPTTADTKFIVAGVTTPYEDTLTPLLEDTTYHVRAYAINSEGTAYGADQEFKTIKSFIS